MTYSGWLSAEKAFFLTQMIDLQAFPTVFVLSYGEVGALARG